MDKETATAQVLGNLYGIALILEHPENVDRYPWFVSGSDGSHTVRAISRSEIVEILRIAEK